MTHETRGFTAARAHAPLATLALLGLLCGDALGAQDVPSVVVQVAPMMQRWSFGRALTQDSLSIRGMTQYAIPLSAFVPLGNYWVFDATGAYTMGRVAVVGSDGSRRDIRLDGPSDIKLRLVGRTRGDRLRLTLGVNAPTGATRATGGEVDALRIIGAPALRMPVPVLGSGFGATAGVIMAQQVGPWAVAFGTSFELRGRYAPIESSIAGVASPTDLDPANALHFTLGLDRLAGAHRVSLLVGSDVYGEDRLSVTSGAGDPVFGSYQLGPSYTALSVLQLGVRGFREFTISALDRYRTRFRGVDGITAAGSNGNFLDVGLRTVSGAPRRFGWLLNLDAHFDTGQEVDNTIATAATTWVGATIGWTIPAGGYAIEPFGRAQVGTLDAGLSSTSLRGFSAGLAWTRR